MIKQKAVRLLLSDVDGTLVTDDRTLTERAKGAVKALRAAGIDFTLASSRPPRGMVPLIHALEVTLPIAGLNGGIVVNPDLSILETHRIGGDAAQSSVDVLASAGLDVWIYTDADWFVLKADGPHVARECQILGFKPSVVPSYTAAQIDHAIKIVGVSDNHDLVASAEAAVTAQLGSRVGAARSEPHFIDVTSPEANKGAVVASFARRLNLRPDQIATMGDMPNDVLMFKQSGFSIAMGNASPQVQASADDVTASNQEDGFAKAVERLLLARQGFDGDEGVTALGSEDV